MAFFLSVGVPSILSPVESHDNSQSEGSGRAGGGGGSAPLTIRSVVFFAQLN